MEENKTSQEGKKAPLFKNEIRLDIIFSLIWKNRISYIKWLPVALIASYVLICFVPRTYKVNVTMAPEYGNQTGGMSGLASSFGINLGSMSGGNDAILPTFYPNLMSSTDFVVSLFDVKVSTLDGSFNGTLRQYISTQQDAPFWLKGIGMVKNLFKKKRKADAKGKPVNAFHLTKTEEEVMNAIKGAMSCNVDTKTDLISLSVVAQDPLVAAQLADTVKARLQTFIIDYRTSKARIELEHMQEIRRQTHADYLAKQKEYIDYADAHQNVVAPSFQMKQTELENELQLAYNNYSNAKLQETAAQAKVLERTPAFTTLQNASVPLKPDGPKRMFFSIFITLLTFVGMTVHFIVKYEKK